MAADAGTCSVLELLDLSAVDSPRADPEASVVGGYVWTFSVMFDKYSASTESLLCGVPQGSVLSPIPFSLYLLLSSC